MSLGMGAMLHSLGGGSPKSASDYYGRKIAEAKLADNQIQIKFDDGVEIKIWDVAQSCCEHRYITSDDDVNFLVGKKLKEIVVKQGPTKDGDWGEHETAFLEVMTNEGCVTFVTHNENNGYYGGFGLSLDEVTP